MQLSGIIELYPTCQVDSTLPQPIAGFPLAHAAFGDFRFRTARLFTWTIDTSIRLSVKYFRINDTDLFVTSIRTFR